MNILDKVKAMFRYRGKLRSIEVESAEMQSYFVTKAEEYFIHCNDG